MMVIKRPPTKGERTRKAIIDRAKVVFEGRRYHEVNAAMIMSELPQAKSTFYIHFDSILDVVAELFFEFTSVWGSREKEWYTAETDLPRHLKKNIRNLSSLTFKDWLGIRLLLEASSQDPAAQAIIDNFAEDVSRQVAQNLRRQQAIGAIRETLDADVMGYQMFHINCRLVSEWVRRPDQDPQGLADQLSSIWIPTFYLLDPTTV